MFPMTGEMEDVISSSRKYAIACGHSFIDYVHLFGGLLTCDCSAKYKLPLYSEAKWKVIAEKFHEQSEVFVDDELHLTKKAEKVIIHSSVYAKQTKSEYISSDHLLLALLSTNNVVAEELQKLGILFEDISGEAFPGFEIKKIKNLTTLPKKSNYTSFDKWLISKESIDGKLNEWHYTAYEFYEAQDYDLCIKACDIAQSLSTENIVFDLLKAYSYYNKGEYSTAITCFLQLIQKFPDEFDYHLALASTYDKIGDYEQASKINKELLIKHPSNAILLNNIGFNLQLQKRYEEAIPYYQSAINADPKFAYPYDNMGFCKYKLGDTEAALNLIDKALELDKGNSYAYKYKGIIFMEQNNKEEALKYFRISLRYGYKSKYGDAVDAYLKQLGE